MVIPYWVGVDRHMPSSGNIVPVALHADTDSASTLEMAKACIGNITAVSRLAARNFAKFFILDSPNARGKFGLNCDRIIPTHRRQHLVTHRPVFKGFI